MNRNLCRWNRAELGQVSKGYEIIILVDLGAVVIFKKKPSKTALRESCAYLVLYLRPWEKHSQEMKTDFKRRVSFCSLKHICCLFLVASTSSSTQQIQLNWLLMGRKICWTENISPPGFQDFEVGTAAASYAEQSSRASLFLWNCLSNRSKHF